ncbi:MAG: RNA-binding domain-containing protein [Candidatus Woesearchaeota archaeon]|jgi:ATP-dependent DNA helicase RecG
MKLKESETIEFKKSLSQLDESLKTICSFLNHKGGTLYFGIDDSGKTIGLTISSNTLKQISQKIADKIKPNILCDVCEIEMDGKNIIEVVVKEGINKPYFLDGISYKRTASETRIIPPDELKRLFHETRKWDEDICKNSSLKDIDYKKFSYYIGEKQKKRNHKDTDKISKEQQLENISATKQGIPTNAGILFFGNYPQKFFSNAKLHAVRFKGNDVTKTTLDSAMIEGSIFEIANDAENFLRKNIRLTGKRVESSFQREDKFEYPILAIREAIINALIHRDYEEAGEVKLFIFDNRLEITNPGPFPVGVDPNNPKHKPRNNLLCQYMYDIGDIEKYGSGIRNMELICKDSGNELPIYNIDNYDTKIMFKSIITEESEHKVPKSPRKVPEKSQKILDAITENSSISREEISIKLGETKDTIQSRLRKLIKDGIIKRVGPDKGGHWEIIR